jgi:hypothetical protein
MPRMFLSVTFSNINRPTAVFGSSTLNTMPECRESDLRNAPNEPNLAHRQTPNEHLQDV